VGSYSRGTANKDSDIDLVILAKNHKNYLSDMMWVNQFGDYRLIKKEKYGKVTSLHIQYLNSHEVEFAITTSAWTKVPPNRGTVEVIQDGIQILYDPHHLFQKIINHITQELPPDKLQHILKTAP
jgi:predicted nucleotidyltransferase